jgi:hypothetical protein
MSTASKDARLMPALALAPTGATQWPTPDGRAAELARSKLEDLCEDPHVVDLLAVEVSQHSARRWRQLQADPGLR